MLPCHMNYTSGKQKSHAEIPKQNVGTITLRWMTTVSGTLNKADCLGSGMALRKRMQGTSQNGKYEG